MITPEGAGTRTDRPQRSRLALLGVAALIVFAGLIAVGSLTSPDPEAAPESATTTAEIDSTTTTADIEPPVDTDGWTVDQIATGESPEWGLSMAIDDLYPMGLFDHEGSIYLFAAEDLDLRTSIGSGLRAWRSDDGVSWEPLGQVISTEHPVSVVASTAQGLVALGSGALGEAFTLWKSDDGVGWKAEEVPTDGAAFHPQAATGTQELLVVSGNPGMWIHDLIQRSLAAKYSNLEPGSYHWTWDVADDTVTITLRSFAGFRLGVVNVDNLGFTEDQKAMVNRWYGEGEHGSEMWMRTASGWSSPEEVPEFNQILTMAATNDGEIIATGFGPNGATTWTTRDGYEWSTPSPAPRPFEIDNWGDAMVGSHPQITSVMVTDDNGNWESIGPADVFPRHVDWGITGLGAGPDGIAAAMDGWGGLLGDESRRVTNPPRVTENNSTLTFDYRTDNYVLDVNGGRHTYWMQAQSQDEIETDLSEGTISFHDPDTGEHLARFQLDAIHREYADYVEENYLGPDHQALIVTPDGANWTIQDLSALGTDSQTRYLEVTGSHLVAVRADGSTLASPTQGPGFEVWSGELP